MYRTGRQPNPNMDMDRNGKQITIATLLLGLWLGVTACRPEKPAFGPEFNPTREKIGLPLIEADAKPEHMFLNERPGEKFFIWRKPNAGQHQSAGKGAEIARGAKHIHYRAEPLEMLYEENVYGKPNDKWIMKNDIDKTEDFTRLKTRYYFTRYYEPNTGIHHPQGWECELNDREHHFTTGGPLKITLAQAGSVLRVWGVNRLNP